MAGMNRGMDHVNKQDYGYIYIYSGKIRNIVTITNYYIIIKFVNKSISRQLKDFIMKIIAQYKK